nr:hypothetical protein [Tanacetum cinerariifolium]
TSLTEFELKKILLDKIEKTKSYQAALKHKELYDELVKSYNLDKDLFSSYGNTSKDAEPPKGSKSKESKSSSSKGTKPQPKSSVDKPDGKAAPKSDWFKKPNKPPTPDVLGMMESLLTLDGLKNGSTTLPKQDNLLAWPTFNVLKGSCKSFVELEFHFKECYKVVTSRLNWNNPKGHEYPFDICKPLPLIEVQGRQVVPADYFFNNDLEYLQDLRLGEIKLLLVAFESQLKVFHPLKNENASGEHPQCTFRSKITSFSRGSIANGFKALNDTKRPTMYLIIWSYKVVRYRYSFPQSSQNWRDLPRDNPLDSVKVLSHDVKKGVKVRIRQ